MGKKKIYVFINGGSPGWYSVMALSEDGYYLAGHISSNKGWAKHDIGLTSNWKHDHYDEAYSDGWELEWVEQDYVKLHEGVMKAYELNQKFGKDGK